MSLDERQLENGEVFEKEGFEDDVCIISMMTGLGFKGRWLMVD
jgi:hypothetical protein